LLAAAWRKATGPRRTKRRSRLPTRQIGGDCSQREAQLGRMPAAARTPSGKALHCPTRDYVLGAAPPGRPREASADGRRPGAAPRSPHGLSVAVAANGQPGEALRNTRQISTGRRAELLLRAASSLGKPNTFSALPIALGSRAPPPLCPPLNTERRGQV
jgi:hypothetical protein